MMELGGEAQMSATLVQGASVEDALQHVMLSEEHLLATHPMLISYKVKELKQDEAAEVKLSTGEQCTHAMEARDAVTMLGCCSFKFGYTVKACVIWNEDHSECSAKSEAQAILGICTRSEYSIRKVGEAVEVKEYFSVVSHPFYVTEESIARQGIEAHQEVFAKLERKFAA